jgi:ubiquinone/menaquinone biosynthesis C-methylase UbiE
VHADATTMPFPDERFSAALSFTMLHHVPTPELQDRLLAEVARVLRPGAVLAGVDSLDSDEFRGLHEGDICVPIPPEGLEGRLREAGFSQAEVEVNEYAVRFRART